MAFGLLLVPSVFGGPVKVATAVGLSREKVAAILGKPKKSTVHGNAGVIDFYKVNGLTDLRFSYLGNPSNPVPFDVKVTFPNTKTLQEALAAAGVDAKGTTTRRSPADGSTLVEGARNLPKGWKASYWNETSKPNRTRLDFLSPEHH
jgi:hypothetical protein